MYKRQAEERAVDYELFAVGAAEGFRPGELARVSLHFEVFVAVGGGGVSWVWQMDQECWLERTTLTDRSGTFWHHCGRM